MSGLKIVCPICTEEFSSADDIYSTSCGHLYHYRCMQEWQSRSTSCPQCREYNPTKHKIFLNLEDAGDTLTAPLAEEDLNIKLESSIDKINELQAQLQECEINFFHLQEQYTFEQDLRKQLEHRAAQSTNNESNFLRLHAQYSEIEDRCKILQEENDRLSIENEYKSKELDVNATKIASLEVSAAAMKGSSCSDQTGNTKIDILQQKLKYVTDELQKEISNSTNLAIDNMKLQSYIQGMDIQAKLSWTKPAVSNRENNGNILNVKDESCNFSRQDTPDRHIDSSSVLLYNVPLKQINGLLQQIVIAIGTKINVRITDDDIKNVKTLLGIGRLQPLSTTVYVQFKTDDLKKNFLANRESLKKDDMFGKVIIKEYIDERVHSLFMYAKKKLLGHVFSQITCKDNQILAKRQHGKGYPQFIHSREQVDGLLRNHLAKKNNEPTIYLQEDKIDKSYYKID